MYGSQIDRLCKIDDFIKNKYRGTYAVDTVPALTTGPYVHGDVYVINTSMHTMPGSHWIGVLCHGDTVSFIDPLGMQPKHYHMERWLTASRSHINSNSKVIQSNHSQLCGNFVIMCLHYLCAGESLSKVMSRFSSDTLLNDRLVASFSMKMYKFNVHTDLVPWSRLERREGILKELSLLLQPDYI